MAIVLPLVGLFFGAISGSFIAALVIRWPRGESVVAGRSHCDACGTTLSARELIPVVSHLVQRGRCRTCNAPIDSRHLAIELAAALIGATALFVSPDAEGALGAIFGWTLLALAALDIDKLWLPDRLTLPLMALGLIAAPLTRPDTTTARIIGALAGYLALSLIAWGYRKYRGREGLGGGDPKLLAAIGAWLGWMQLPFALLLASLAGLLFALTRRERMTATTQLPFGAFLAIAAWPLWILSQG